MEPNYYVIFLAPGCIEGLKIGVEKKGPFFCDEIYSKLWDNDLILESEQNLEEFIKFHNWEQGYVRAILSVSLVSTRSLTFPFSDPKKIKQALHFKVESELLQEVDSVQIAYQILPNEQGAEVIVYTTPKYEIERLHQVMSHHDLLLYEVSFYGHALLHALPQTIDENEYYQVYIGIEEVFVNCVKGRQLVKNKFFQTQFLDILKYLFATELEIDPNEETELEEDEAFVLLETDKLSGDTSVFENEPRKELVQEMIQLCSQLNFFFSTMPEREILIHGRLADLVSFDGQTFQPQMEQLDQWIQNNDEQWGLLSTLAQNTHFLNTKYSPVSFYSKTKFLGFLMLRKFAIRAFFVVFLLIVTSATLGIGSYWEKVISEQEAIQNKRLLRERLQILLPDIPVQSLTQAMQLLREKVQKRQDELELSQLFVERTYSNLNLLKQISNAFPAFAESSIDHLKVFKSEVIISGQAKNYDQLEEIRKIIEGLKFFPNQTVKVTNNKTSERVLFQILIRSENMNPADQID